MNFRLLEIAGRDASEKIGCLFSGGQRESCRDDVLSIEGDLTISRNSAPRRQRYNARGWPREGEALFVCKCADPSCYRYFRLRFINFN